MIATATKFQKKKGPEVVFNRIRIESYRIVALRSELHLLYNSKSKSGVTFSLFVRYF